MNTAEYTEWTARLKRRIPTLGEYLEVHPDLSFGWGMDLTDYSLAECTQALDDIAHNRELMPPVHERDFFTLFVIEAIKRRRREATAEQQAAEDAAMRDYPERGAWDMVTKGPGMKEAYEKTVAYRRKLREDGKTQDEINRLATEYVRTLFADMPDDPRDRWACLLCRDTGWVPCFEVSAMQAARAHVMRGAPFDAERALRTRADVSCCCPRGRETWNDRRKGQTIQLPRYDKAQWVRLEAGIEGLLQWAAEYVPPYLRGQV